MFKTTLSNLYDQDFLLDRDEFYDRADLIIEENGFNNKMSLVVDTVAYDSYNLAKYNALNFEEFKNHLIKSGFNDCMDCDIKKLNSWILDEISKSYITVMNALAYRNIGFAMRVANQCFSLIIKGAFLNIHDKNGKYFSLESFKNSFNEYNTSCLFENLLDDSLEWARDVAQSLNDSYDIFESFDNTIITVDVLRRLLKLYDLGPSLINTNQFLDYSISELFANTKNPAIEYYFLPIEEDFNRLAEIEKEYMNNSIVNEAYVFQTLSCLIESSLEFLTSLVVDQEAIDSFIYYSNLILADKEELEDDESDSDFDDVDEDDEYDEYDESIYDEGFISSEELEYPFDVRFCDPFFYNLLVGNNTKTLSDYNRYFSEYKNSFLVSSDFVDDYNSLYSNSISLSYKYLNMFRSLLIGVRFNEVDYNPSKVLVKDSIFKNFIDTQYSDKFIFDSTEFAIQVLNIDEPKNHFIVISVFQVLNNIFNSIISNNILSCINEVKVLISMAVINTYININDDDYLNDFLNESLLVSKQNIENVRAENIFIDTIDEIDDLSYCNERKIVQEILSDEEIDYSDAYERFSFSDGLNISKMIDFIKQHSGTNLDIFEKVNLNELYNLISNPFATNDKCIDGKLSCVILKCSKLVVNSLMIDPLYSNNDKFKDIVRICNEIIKNDMSLIKSE